MNSTDTAITPENTELGLIILGIVQILQLIERIYSTVKGGEGGIKSSCFNKTETEVVPKNRHRRRSHSADLEIGEIVEDKTEATKAFNGVAEKVEKTDETVVKVGTVPAQP